MPQACQILRRNATLKEKAHRLSSNSLHFRENQNYLKPAIQATRQHQEMLPNAVSQESHLKQPSQKRAGKAEGKAWNTSLEPGDKKSANLQTYLNKPFGTTQQNSGIQY